MATSAFRMSLFLVPFLLLACGDKEDPGTGGADDGDASTDDTGLSGGTDDGGTDDGGTDDGGDDGGGDEGGEDGSEPVDADGDGFFDDVDCDDGDKSVFPGATEKCNGVDDDCDGEVPASELDLTGDGLLDCEPVDCDALAMTWGQSSYDADYSVVTASCYAGDSSCNAYHGDAECADNRALLCAYDADLANPESFPYWSGEELELTEPISGCQLTERTMADDVCEGTFGAGWRMATFHDAGGWYLAGSGDFETKERFVVAIDNQPANCWDSAGSGRDS